MCVRANAQDDIMTEWDLLQKFISLHQKYDWIDCKVRGKSIDVQCGIGNEIISKTISCDEINPTG